MDPREDMATDVCRNITWASAQIRKEFDKVLSSDGLTAPQFGILHQLATDGPMPLSELGKRLWVSCGNVTGLVDKLVEAGCVRRVRLRKDRRVVLAEPTEKGKELVRILDPLRQESMTRFASHLDQSDLKALQALLDKLHRSHDKGPAAVGTSEEKE